MSLSKGEKKSPVPPFSKGDEESRAQTQSFISIFRRALDEESITISTEKQGLLERHYLLLEKWNSVHNLTTIKNIKDVVYNHYIDCIKGVFCLPNVDEVFDVGSGAGFPGVVAAILLPKTKFYLVESSRKKCSFLSIVVDDLKIKNIDVVPSRVEKVEKIKFAISRATFSIPFLKMLTQKITEEGQIALWTTETSQKKTQEEMKSLGFATQETFEYQWEGISPRKILLFKKI